MVLVHEVALVPLLAQPPQPMFTDCPPMSRLRDRRFRLEVEGSGSRVTVGTRRAEGAFEGRGVGWTELLVRVESDRERRFDERFNVQLQVGERHAWIEDRRRTRHNPVRLGQRKRERW